MYTGYKQRTIDGGKIDVLLILKLIAEAEIVLYDMPRVQESWNTVNVLYVLMFAAIDGSGLVCRSRGQERLGLVAMNKEGQQQDPLDF